MQNLSKFEKIVFLTIRKTIEGHSQHSKALFRVRSQIIPQEKAKHFHVLIIIIEKFKKKF